MKARVPVLTARLFLFVLLIALGALASAPRAQAAQMLSVATRLNPDGTLDLANGVNGAFDLRG